MPDLSFLLTPSSWETDDAASSSESDTALDEMFMDHLRHRVVFDAKTDAVASGEGSVEVRESGLLRKAGKPGEMGLYAVKPIKKGSRIGQYTGQIISKEELNRRHGHRTAPYVLQVHTADGRAVYVDASDPQRSSAMRYINCVTGFDVDPNVRFDQDGEVVATADIAPGEELLTYYGADYWRSGSGANFLGEGTASASASASGVPDKELKRRRAAEKRRRGQERRDNAEASRAERLRKEDEEDSDFSEGPRRVPKKQRAASAASAPLPPTTTADFARSSGRVKRTATAQDMERAVALRAAMAAANKWNAGAGAALGATPPSPSQLPPAPRGPEVKLFDIKPYLKKLSVRLAKFEEEDKELARDKFTATRHIETKTGLYLPTALAHIDAVIAKSKAFQEELKLHQTLLPSTKETYLLEAASLRKKSIADDERARTELYFAEILPSINAEIPPVLDRFLARVDAFLGRRRQKRG